MRYKKNDGGDAWIDRKGRVWYCSDYNHLPSNPEEHESIPPAYWHPAMKAEWENEQSWVISIERAVRQ